MTRFIWRVVGALSELLEPDERDAVCGDFAELNVTGGRAFRDVLGLIARRQAAVWKDWRPWAAVIALAIPLGIVLSLVARQFSNGAAVYAWTYRNWWTWTILTIPRARQDLVRTVGGFLLEFAALAAWSWSAGAALGSLSRRAINITAPTFYFAVFAGTFASITSGEANPFNASVFSLPFFSVVVPVFVKTAFVSLPALAGMHRGIQGPRLRARGMIVLAVGIVALTAHSAAAIEGSIVWTQWQLGEWRMAGYLLRDTWPVALVPVAIAWPAVYLATTTSWQQWHRNASAAAS